MSGYSTRAAVLRAIGDSGISHHSLAARLDVTPEWLSGRLGARSALTVTEVRDIARVLGVDAERLLDAGGYVCGECGGVGSAPTHRISCPRRGQEVLSHA